MRGDISLLGIFEGCVQSSLGHVGSLLWHEGFSLVVGLQAPEHAASVVAALSCSEACGMLVP